MGWTPYGSLQGYTRISMKLLPLLWKPYEEATPGDL